VFGGLDYPHDLSHDLSERTVYIPSTSLCCYGQQRAITASTSDELVAESLTKDSLLAVIPGWPVTDPDCQGLVRSVAKPSPDLWVDYVIDQSNF
jgi:hypothetical protein